MSNLILALLLSISPFSELRGGIPVAIGSGVNPLLAFILCVALNILVIFPIFFFLDHLHGYFLGNRFYERLSSKYLNSARRRATRYVERFGYIGLTLFVSIPLPITGAYTGSLAAWVFGMRRKKAYLAIALGVLIAGIIITLASIGLFSLL